MATKPKLKDINFESFIIVLLQKSTGVRYLRTPFHKPILTTLGDFRKFWAN